MSKVARRTGMFSLSILLLLLFFLSFGLNTGTVVGAQAGDDPILTWIPADFAGYVALDTTDPVDTVNQIGYMTRLGTFLQPDRLSPELRAERILLTDFFPLETLDVEDFQFEPTVLPWIDRRIVVAYRTLGEGLTTTPDDVALILPARDTFAAAGYFQPIVEAQDFGEQTTYRDASLFIGDQTAIAFTAEAVLIGAQPVLEALLDARAGAVPRLIETPAYEALRAASDQPTRLVEAYFTAGALPALLSGALSTDASAPVLLSAVGAALTQFDPASPLAPLLSGAAEGAYLSLHPDPILGSVDAAVWLYTPGGAAEAAPPAVPNAALDRVPRSAMFVYSGSDADTALYHALIGASVGAYAGNLLGAFPLGAVPLPAAPEQPLPKGDQIAAAVEGTLDGLRIGADFDVSRDLAAHLDGGYALALIPRPNNPSPFNSLPYDVLVAAEAADADAAAASLTRLFTLALALSPDALTVETIAGAPFTVYGDGVSRVVSIGAADGALIVATGDAAALAVQAGRGDNRLNAQSRWLAVTDADQPPALYADLNALWATFFPQPGGAVDQGIGQVGVHVRYAGGGVWHALGRLTVP